MPVIEFMQRIIVKNLTNGSLTNIQLTHDGEGNGNYKSIIKELKSNEFREISLYTLRANKLCNLILTYTYEGISKTVIVHDKLSRNDLRLITLKINEEKEKIIINTIIDNNLW